MLLLERSCSEMKEIWHISCQLTIADKGHIFLFRVATAHCTVGTIQIIYVCSSSIEPGMRL